MVCEHGEGAHRMMGLFSSFICKTCRNSMKFSTYLADMSTPSTYRLQSVDLRSRNRHMASAACLTAELREQVEELGYGE